MKNNSMNKFVSLFHRRWAVPVLAEIERNNGAKFITLAKRLGVSRDSLRGTLDLLIKQGWVMRNPGYGHPMRPEYLLTKEGSLLAPTSGRLVTVVRRLRIEPLAFRKWSMPVTYLLGTGLRRFSELKSDLPGITSRALTLSLKDLQEGEIVDRNEGAGRQ